MASPGSAPAILILFFLTACASGARNTPPVEPVTPPASSGIAPAASNPSTFAAALPSPTSNPTDAGMSTSTPAEPTPDWSVKSRQVDELFASYITGRSPGAAVIVIQDGKIAHEAGYGLADLAKGTPVTPSQIFHLASVGKQFTALAVLILVEKGKLDLDDPVEKYLPELANFGNGVTIRRLLNDTSGIPDAYSGDLYKALMQQAARPTNADLLAVLSTADGLLFDPGFQFKYSNTGYDVLGALIERVSGESYPDFLEENIFGPLGMKNSFSLPSPRQKTDPLLAHSYVKYQGVIQPYDTYWLDDIVGSGTIYSNVEDMFLYDQALYTDAIIPQSTLAEAFQPAVLYDGVKYPYGFGWEIKDENGIRSYWHSGKWLGYRSFYERFPDLKLSIVVLMNWNYGPTVEDVESSIRKIYLD
ncbi:MAG: serine hydrolase domain-containing protein [Anaerolineales bacterium]